MKQGKLQNIKQTHGKDERTPKRTLDQVLGYTGVGKYKTMDLEEYKGQLAKMNKSDLYKHALENNLLPIDSRELLEKRLIREFERHVSSFETSLNVAKEISKNKSLNKKAIDILSYGK